MKRWRFHHRSRRVLAALLTALSLVGMGAPLDHTHTLADPLGGTAGLVEADPLPTLPLDPGRAAEAGCGACVQQAQVRSAIASRCELDFAATTQRPLELALEPAQGRCLLAGLLHSRGPPSAV